MDIIHVQKKMQIQNNVFRYIVLLTPKHIHSRTITQIDTEGDAEKDADKKRVRMTYVAFVALVAIDGQYELGMVGLPATHWKCLEIHPVLRLRWLLQLVLICHSTQT